MTTSYNKDDLESVLRYLTGEYGVEILAGQGKIPGKHDVMRLLPDFFSKTHRGDYSMMSMMVREGIMTKLLSLRESGISGDECRRQIAIETQKLTANFIPQEVAAKYVNMIAGIMGLKFSAVVVQTAPTPKPQPAPKPKMQPVAQPKPKHKPAAKPKRPAMSDDEFLELCASGTARAVEEALENGANVNARYIWGSTALHEAAQRGNADVAEVLLQHGADINATTKYNSSTALHEVAINGRADVAEVLLKHGADINARDNDGETALDIAQHKGYSNIVELLRAQNTGSLAQPAAKPKRKRPAMSDDEFLELCKFGTAREVEEALQNGANVNARDDEGMTALCIASDDEDVELVEVLLKYGADVNAKDDYEYTALMYAACDRNDEDSNGKKKQAILEALLRHGADIHAQNEDGSTALHLAVQNGHLAAVKVLLKHGANVNIKDNDGKTPLDCVPYDANWLASEFINEIADALRNPKRYAGTGRNSVNDYDFLELCRTGTAREVEKALQHGANINARDDFGWTALYLAALHQHADVVEVLLRHGAHVNARNYEGETALHEAAYRGKADVAEILLKHGADINARDNSGRTALDLAQQKGHSDVVELLRSKNTGSAVVNLPRAKDTGSPKDTRSFWARLFS